MMNEILNQKGMTKYRLSKISGVPYTTVNDICSGKTRPEKCSAETLYKIAGALKMSMEELIVDSLNRTVANPSESSAYERSYEYGLPEYLQNDLDAYKEALKNGSSLLDCLWGELYGSINAAEITDGVITPEHADYLRKKYLWR